MNITVGTTLIILLFLLNIILVVIFAIVSSNKDGEIIGKNVEITMLKERIDILEDTLKSLGYNKDNLIYKEIDYLVCKRLNNNKKMIEL